jgi:hypothetical protein
VARGLDRRRRKRLRRSDSEEQQLRLGVPDEGLGASLDGCGVSASVAAVMRPRNLGDIAYGAYAWTCQQYARSWQAAKNYLPQDSLPRTGIRYLHT